MSIMRGRPLPFLFLFLSLIAACSAPVAEKASFGDVSPATFAIGFSPKGESLPIILKAIGSAEHSILVAAYSFTSTPIAAALLAAHRRGVDVRVLADAKANSGRYSALAFLANQGVPARINSRYAIFHHKFMVIDKRHLETGSFNFSAAAADKNAENVLLLRDVPELAGIYAREWEKLWQEGEEVKARY